MKRAPIVLTATAAGLAATIGFHAHRSAATLPKPTVAAVSSGAPTSTTSSASTSTSTSAAAQPTSSSVTSDAIGTQYGDVQLKVTLSNGRVIKIEPVQLPSGDSKSVEISDFAEPQLSQSALAKQSANIDAVSGATFTSDGYRTALQSALDKAGSQASTSATTAG